jgi:hypothetical protein
MENGIKHIHCWHDEGVVLTSYPPQVPEICCHCGEKRIKPNPFTYKDLSGHGPFLKPGIDWWKGDPTCGGIAENYQPKGVKNG